MNADLATWLRAQLNADEQWVGCLPTDADYERCAVTGSLSINHMRALRVVTDTWKADLAAKRRIIAGYEAAEKYAEVDEWDASNAGVAAGLWRAVIDLASAYADRPGYQPEWAPEA